MRLTCLVTIMSIFLAAPGFAGDGFEELLSAARHNNEKRIEEFFEFSLFGYGAVEPWTPLHEAALWNSVAAAQKLLDLGARVNARDGNGWTPLFVARNKGHTEMIKFLLSKNAL